MANRAQLPYLMKLLEDESPTVHEAVIAELAGFGPDLETELVHQGIILTEHDSKVLHEAIRERERNWLRSAWPSWYGVEGEKERLEAALVLIADFMEHRSRPGRMAWLLDELADEYRSERRPATVWDLSQFLFAEKRFRGAKEDYYNPSNSNLVYVLERRRGIPISLVILLMLVGKRVGVDVEGCNFPGHFLALAHDEGGPSIIDCYNGGLLVDDRLLARYLDPVSVTVQELTRLQCDTATIIGRVLRNLINAFRAAGQAADVQLMQELLSHQVGKAEN
jgi:regulator of sirC expression with transglutaminase-like and TPR domain